MKLYNTLTRRKEELETIEPNKIRMYVCGPTVYNFIHIGNARPYVVFDTIRRYLEYKGYEVNYVQNYTDVDDKIIKQANLENVTMDVIANRYIEEVRKDAKGLNVKDATVNPRVTGEMEHIIALIKELIEKGFAYEKNGTVYFDTKKFEEYGKLSKKNLEELEAGARVDVDSEKNSTTDFVLWKPYKPGEPGWSSPWGEGRPGWHIECSAMAKRYLGETIDIHAGGEDLIFPHHENEVAQSEAANGKPFAKYWMHNAFVNIDNQKMSKSKGNFFTLREIVEHFPYEVIRFFILSAHYRSPINFSDELVKSAENSLGRIKNAVTNLNHLIKNAALEPISEDEKALLAQAAEFKKNFEASMDDDFNTADAVSTIFEYVRFANTNTSDKSTKEFTELVKQGILELGSILGMDFEKTEEEAGDDAENAEIESLIQQRKEARANKDWAAADRIRDELNQRGIDIKDTPSGILWSRRGK